jgi:hypothetical protein
MMPAVRGETAMPRAVPLPVRQSLVRASLDGTDTAELAARFALPRRTVQHLLRQARLTDGQPSAPAYRQGPRPPGPRADLFDLACALRREHPTWGGGLIHVVLGRLHPGRALPAVRTLQRRLARDRLAPAPAGRRPAREPRSVAAHDTWQMDAAEKMRLDSGGSASWLRVTDECSGAVLGTVVFPPGELHPGSPRPDA